MSTTEEKMRALNEKLDAFKDEVQGLLEKIEEGAAPLDEISATFIDFFEKYKTSTALWERLIGAIKSLQMPAAQVNVNPTPIHNHVAAPVVQIVERAPALEYKFEVKYDGFDRITSATIIPIAKK